MGNNVLFKTSLLKGPQGDRGEAGEADSVPVNGILSYDGETIPTGYEETEAPEVITGILNDLETLGGDVTQNASDISALDTRLTGDEDLINANASNIEVQTARIDAITQLPSGSTSGDAELIDIRVGSDGITYASAGASVRTQFDKRDREALIALGCKDLLKGVTYKNGYVILKDGTESSSQYTKSYSATDFIPVQPPFVLSWPYGYSRNSTVVPPICCYDSNKNYVCTIYSKFNKTAGSTFLADSRVAYIRANIYPNSEYNKNNIYLLAYDGPVGESGLYKALNIKNLYKNANIIESYVVDKTGSAITSQNTDVFAVTDYIEITTPTKISWAYGQIWGGSSNLPSICTYDSNKDFIRSYYNTENNAPGEAIIFDSNVKYVRYNIVQEATFSRMNQYLVSYFDNNSSLEYYDTMLDLDNIIADKYLDRSGQEQNTSQYTSGYAITPYLELEKTDCVIEWRRGNNDNGSTIPAVCVYDENKTFLYAKYSEQSMTPGSFRLNDSNAKYIRYNVTPAAWNFQRSSDYLNCYVDRNVQTEYKFKALEEAGVRNKVVVSKDGSGDFSTWKDATEYCWTHPNTDVYVYAGEYDLIEEYGDTYLNNIPAQYDRNHSIGPECGYNCRYIFSAGAKLVANYDGDNSLVATYFSPVNIIGSCEFENMFIECSNTRYCVHEDLPTVISPMPANVKVKYKNCHLKHNGNSAGWYSNIACIGAGCGIDSVSEVDGGSFICPQGIAISYHLPSGINNSNCEVWIHDAYCDGYVQSSDFPTDKTGTLYFYVNGCSLSQAVTTGTKTVGYIYNNIVRTS